MAVWSKIVAFLSFEWILTKYRRPNGGDIILMRAILIASLLYFSAIGVKSYLEPERVLAFDSEELRKQISSTLHWFGALLGSIYAALYTRFASQWRYLANLYNKIKETEAKYGDAASKDAIAFWKAGFLEDADDLHLAKKQLFVSVLNAWGKDNKVKSAFVKYSPGGTARFTALMNDVKEAYDRYNKCLGGSPDTQNRSLAKGRPTTASSRHRR